MHCVRDPEKRWIGRTPAYSNRRTRRISQNRIEYLAKNNRKRIKKSGVKGIEPSFLTDYAYLAGPDATLFRT
jgi:hypothetical protein